MPAVVVWDRFVRVMHWTIACLVIVDMLNEAGANPWHRYLGYVAGMLVTARLAWGMFGTPHARLITISKLAASCGTHLATWRASAKPAIYVGHNPLGAAMALLLWSLIILVVVTGWMLQLDAYWGDDRMERVHAIASYCLALCAVIHVLGVFVTSLLHRINLVKAMVTGSKSLPHTACAGQVENTRQL